MAQHASAKKRIRQTKRRTQVNRARVSRIRTFLRRVESAIAGGKKDEAVAAYNQAQPESMRVRQQGGGSSQSSASQTSLASHSVSR